MDAMNVQSSSTGLDDLLFYIVPATWYRKLWRLLLQPSQLDKVAADWREQIGGLPHVKKWWEDGSATNKVAPEQHPATQQKGLVLQELHSVWKRDKKTAHATRKTHEKDYFFVGKNAWTVLQNKFGTADNTGIPCHCVSFPSQDSRLAVNLPDGTRIPISGSGRFSYEESLMKEEEAEDVVRFCL
jgi:hypothetical protein